MIDHAIRWGYNSIMETKHIPAVFEAGTFRPLVPIDLAEHEHMELTVVRAGGEDAEENYIPALLLEANGNVTLGQVQEALAKIPGSLVEDFVRERDERF